jgi:hypothetical protein
LALRQHNVEVMTCSNVHYPAVKQYNHDMLAKL